MFYFPGGLQHFLHAQIVRNGFHSRERLHHVLSRFPVQTDNLENDLFFGASEGSLLIRKVEKLLILLIGQRCGQAP